MQATSMIEDTIRERWRERDRPHAVSTGSMDALDVPVSLAGIVHGRT